METYGCQEQAFEAFVVKMIEDNSDAYLEDLVGQYPDDIRVPIKLTANCLEKAESQDSCQDILDTFVADAKSKSVIWQELTDLYVRPVFAERMQVLDRDDYQCREDVERIERCYEERGKVDEVCFEGQLPEELLDGIGGIIAAKGVQFGSGGLGSRGSGLGGGGTSGGLGGLGTKGRGRGASGYGRVSATGGDEIKAIIDLNNVLVVGPISKDTIIVGLKIRRSMLGQIYNKDEFENVDTKGQVTVSMQIDKTGHVIDVACLSDDVDEQVKLSLQENLKRHRFNTSEQTQDTHVVFTIQSE